MYDLRAPLGLPPDVNTVAIVYCLVNLFAPAPVSIRAPWQRGYRKSEESPGACGVGDQRVIATILNLIHPPTFLASHCPHGMLPIIFFGMSSVYRSLPNDPRSRCAFWRL